MSLPIGTILGQRYELRAFIGSDGTLEVYKGLDLRLGRDVALTVLEIVAIQSPEELINFEKEAQIRAGLHHPRIMTVHDFGHGAGCAYQVAEWLDGQSLRKRLQRGPLIWKEARDIGEAVIEGLVIILRKGFTLRVMDTTSIFLQSDGQVKLFAYQLKRIEGNDILKTQKEGLQALARTLVLALGDGQETADPAVEWVLPTLKIWAGTTELDASSLRREFEHLLQETPAPPTRPPRRRWVSRTALIVAVPVFVALYLQRARSSPPAPSPPVAEPIPAGDPEAHRLYLQGLVWLETLEPDNLRKAQTYLQSAIARNAREPLYFSGLAKCYCLQGLVRMLPREDALRLAQTATQTALDLNPNLGEAHAALAFRKAWYELDWTGAEQDYRRALALAPNQAAILRDLAGLLALEGESEESLRLFRSALALDPLSRSTRASLAVYLHWAGRSKDSLEEFARALEQDPASRDTLLQYREVLEQMGRIEDSLKVADRLATLDLLREKEVVALRTAFEACGVRGYWSTRIRQAEQQPDRDAVALAELVSLQGDQERAFRLLARGLREKSFLALRIPRSPALVSLHQDPQFQKLLDKVGFPAH